MVSTIKNGIKMRNETKISILEALDRHSEGLHLRKLAQTVNGSFPNVRRFVQNLAAEGVVKAEPQGNLLNIKLQDSLPTTAYLKSMHTMRFLSLPRQIVLGVTDILNKLSDKPLIALIYGNYADKPSSLNSSPIELLLVFQNLNNIEELKQTVHSISLRHKIRISPVIVDYSKFQSSFLEKDHLLSNKIRLSSIILVGVEYYYSLYWRFLQR